MTAAERWRQVQGRALAQLDFYHPVGPYIYGLFRQADLALVEAVLERVQVSVMNDQGIPDPRDAAIILAELEQRES